MATCRKCGANPQITPGVCLRRVNELGVAGIWECRPNCEAGLSQDEAILLAIEDDDEDAIIE